MNNNINEIENNKDELHTLDPMNINKELLNFKNEISKEIKDMQKKINDRIEITNNVFNDKFILYDEKLNEFNEQLIKLTNLIIDDSNLKEKVDELMKAKSTYKESILAHDKQIKTLEKDYKNKITEINKILSETVIYPNVIGEVSKIKTFHEFIDYVLNQIDQANSFNEKNTINLNNYKKHLENIIKHQQLQLDNISKSTNELIIKSVNSLEDQINNILPLCEEKIQSLKVENQFYASSMEQYYRDLNEEFKRFHIIKNNIYNRFNNDIYNMKKDNQQVMKTFGNYKNELNLIKDKFTKLSDFIKDIRFRRNLGDLKRKFFLEMANELDCTKKKDISAELKNCLQGEIKLDESTSTQKFSNTLINNIYNDNELNKGNDDFMNNIFLKKKLYFGNNIANYEHRLKTAHIRKKIEYPNYINRKSVYNLLNPLYSQDNKSFSSPKILLENSLEKKDYSNEDIKYLEHNYKMSINRLSESSEITGRKVNQGPINNDKTNTNSNKDNNNINIVKPNDNDSEKKKNNNDNNQNCNNNNEKEIIKEEEEDIQNIIKPINPINVNQNKFIREADKNQLCEEEKTINNEKEIESNETIQMKNILYENINKEFIQLKNDKNHGNEISNNSENNNKKNDYINNEININEGKIKSEKKIKKNKENENKIDIIKRERIIIRSDKNHNSIDNNSDFKQINSIINEKFTKNIKNNQKDINDNDKSSIDNDTVIISKTALLNEKNKIETKFAKTSNNLKIKKYKNNFNQSNNNYFQEYKNFDKRKDFKGKKYKNISNSIVMKIKDNMVPYESHSIMDNSNINNISNFIAKSVKKEKSNKNVFNSEDKNMKYYLSINGKNGKKRMNEAKDVEKIVNNLRSYINDKNNMDINDTNTTKNKKNNNLFEELNCSCNNYQNKNNSYMGANTSRKKDNTIKIKLK